MTAIYTTREGDMIDAIAWRSYGRTHGKIVEQLIEANPVLAQHGPQLPANVEIILPPVQPESGKKALKLWD